MKLFLFTTNSELAICAQRGNVYSIIIDWESKGKNARQRGHDLEINIDTSVDLLRIREKTSLPITVRINALDKDSGLEINKAINLGASIIMLPMAKSGLEVEKFLTLVNGRAKTLVQIETMELATDIQALCKLSWDYAYIGLNDLMLSRKGTYIWEALEDGVVEDICRLLKGRVYGFGGVTVVDGGVPLKCRLLMHEYIRLGCEISFLRRTFKREIVNRDVVKELHKIHSFLEKSSLRGEAAREKDHNLLLCEIRKVYEKDHNSYV